MFLIRAMKCLVQKIYNTVKTLQKYNSVITLKYYTPIKWTITDPLYAMKSYSYNFFSALSYLCDSVPKHKNNIK